MRNMITTIFLVTLLFLLSSFVCVPRKCVLASWYGLDHQGKKTASGERFNMYLLTAAHKTLPFGTKVRIRNKENGRQVTVVINDRGPFIKGRTFDLSRAAFRRLSRLDKGTIRVTYKIIK